MCGTSSSISAAFGMSVAFLIGAYAFPTFAQDSVDATFAPVIRGPGTVQAMIWNPEGFAYAAVNADKVNGIEGVRRLVRFSRAGGWDPSYQPAVDGSISAMHVQRDGRWLIAGSFSSVDGHATSGIARMNADGSVDTGFSVASSVAPSKGNILCLTSDTDGNIFVGLRAFPSYQWVDGNYQLVPASILVKINASGAKDASFTPSFELGSSSIYSSSETRINTIAVQSDGKILVGGNFAKVNGYSQSTLARLHPSGTLDLDYAPVLSFTNSSFSSRYSMGVETLQLLEGDVALVGGGFSGVNGYSQLAVAKISSIGQLDLSFRVFFNSSWSWSWPSVYTARQDSLGRILLVGSWGGIESQTSSIASGRAARVDNSGRLDPSFSASFGNQDKVVIIPEDYMVFGRSGSLSSNYVVQPAMAGYLNTGSRDASFSLDLRKRNAPDFMAVRPNLGPIIGGTFILEINGRDISGPVGLGASGQTDSLFNLALTPAASGRAVLRLPDGRFLVGGGFTSCNGVSRPRLALCRSDGSTEEAFDLGTGPDGVVDLLKLLPTGEILVGGSFSKINGIDAKNVALLDLSKLERQTNLSVQAILDAHYGSETSWSDVTALLQGALVDGLLTVTASNAAMGGDSAPGQTKRLSMRYLTSRGERTVSVAEGQSLTLPNIPWDTGLIDPAFRPDNTETLFLSDAEGTSDGKVYLVGSFSTFAGESLPRMVRLLSTGEIDLTFRPQGSFSSFYPRKVRNAPGYPNAVWIAGYSISETSSSDYRGIFRLQTNGAVDASFTCPSFISSVEDILPLTDGRIFAAGSFNSSTSGERKRIALLSQTGAIDSGFDSGDSANSTVESLSVVTPNKLYFLGSFTSVQGVPQDGLALLTLQTAIPPQATLIPVGEIVEGQPASLWLSGVGENETIQWFQHGSSIQAANGSVLRLREASLFDSGDFSVVLGNAAGSTAPSSRIFVREFTFAQWAASHRLSGATATDSDNDSMSDYEEYLARTDPNDPSSAFRATAAAHNGQLRLLWATAPGRTYALKSSENLSDWTPEGAPVSGNGALFEATLPITQGAAKRFYSVTVEKLE